MSQEVVMPGLKAWFWKGAIGGLGLILLAGGTAASTRATAAAAGQSAWIQVAAHGPGLHGSRWRTDLGLRNVGAAPATVEVRFYPMGGGGPLNQTVEVAAGVQSVLEDVVAQLGGSGSGAVEIVFSERVIVNSRTYNLIAPDAACSPGGTFGQYYPAHRPVDGLANGESAWLGQLAESERFRTNIALTNMSAAAANVQVELFDGAGELLRTFAVDLPPFRYHQEARVFSNRAGTSDIQRGSARITVMTGTGILASASVVDNTTNDPTTIPALQPFEVAGGEITIMLPGDVPLTLVGIAAGTFMMGSPEEERGRGDLEGQQFQAILTRDFFLGKYPVTQRQWLAVMGANPSSFSSCGLDCPVESVRWNDICGGSTGSTCTPGSFVGRLNAHLSATGQLGAGLFRMPTEAEWEYAARAGSTTEFSFPVPSDWDTECGFFPWATAFMWWCGNNVPANQPGYGTKPVGQKLPNPWGLYDMHGNVWEWVADWWAWYPPGPVTDPTGPTSGSYRVIRGGSWASEARECRSAYRQSESQGLWNQFIGFRLARSL